MNKVVLKERAIGNMNRAIGNMNAQKKGQSNGSNKPTPQRKTHFQFNMLESTYASNANPSRDVRAKLSKSLGLTDLHLQMWFYQRRHKDKMKLLSESEPLVKKNQSQNQNQKPLSEDSTSESESESDSSHSNEPLVPLSRVNELTQQKMTLTSLADCVVQMGEALSNDGPAEETRAVEKDSEPKEKTPAASKPCVKARKIPKRALVRATNRALANASVNASKDPMHDNKKRASSLLAKSKTAAPIGDEFGQSAKRSKTLISNTVTISSDSWSQPMDVGIENEVERPQCELKKPMTSSSTSADTQQKASKLNNHVKQDVEKLDRFRTEKLRIKEEEKQAKVRALEAQERAFQKQERLLELQCKALERQEKKEDLELFVKLHDHLSGPMVRVMLEQKREIAEKWGWKWE